MKLLKIKKAFTITLGLIITAGLLQLHYFTTRKNFDVKAAPVYDQVNGTYTDDFSDLTGISSISNTDIDGGNTSLELTPLNTPPFATSGYAITTTIMPELWSSWDSVQVSTTKPAGTTVRLQLLTSTNVLIPDEFLPGNSIGFTSDTVDLSDLPYWGTPSTTYISDENHTYDPDYGRILLMRIRITLETTDTSVTPEVHDLTLSWHTPAGGLTVNSLANTEKPIAGNGASKNNGSNNLAGSVSSPLVFRWSKDFPATAITTKGAIDLNGNLILKTGGSDFKDTYSKFYSIDRSNKNILWELNYPTWKGNSATTFSISDTNIIFYQDYASDLNMAIDSSDGTFLWSAQYGSGHPDDQPLIGSNGLIIFYDGGSTRRVTARDANGNIIWEYPISSVTSVKCALKDNIVYVASSGSGSYVAALNADTGAELWTYTPPNYNYSSILIGEDDNLYLRVIDTSNPNYEYYIVSLDDEGNYRWKYTCPETADYKLLLIPQIINDDTLVVGYSVYPLYDKFYLKFIDTMSGNLVTSKEILPIPESSRVVSNINTDMFIDKNDNVILTIKYSDESAVRVEEQIWITDQNGEIIWKIRNYNNYTTLVPILVDGTNSFYVMEQRGKTSTDISILAMLNEWTINSSTDTDTYTPGQVVHFEVETSMSMPNPFIGGEGQVQVYLSNSDKVTLSKVGETEEGSTWTGEYTVPEFEGNYPYNLTYTAEANYPGIETTQTLHFDEPASLSSNTGVIATGTIQIENLPATGESLSVTMLFGLFVLISSLLKRLHNFKSKVS